MIWGFFFRWGFGEVFFGQVDVGLIGEVFLVLGLLYSCNECMTSLRVGMALGICSRMFFIPSAKIKIKIYKNKKQTLLIVLNFNFFSTDYITFESRSKT